MNTNATHGVMRFSTGINLLLRKSVSNKNPQCVLDQMKIEADIK